MEEASKVSETGKTKALAHEIKINQEPDSEEPADDSLCQGGILSGSAAAPLTEIFRN